MTTTTSTDKNITVSDITENGGSKTITLTTEQVLEARATIQRLRMKANKAVAEFVANVTERGINHTLNFTDHRAEAATAEWMLFYTATLDMDTDDGFVEQLCELPWLLLRASLEVTNDSSGIHGDVEVRSKVRAIASILDALMWDAGHITL